MRRVPLVATLIVALAVAAMIALGLWQLDRLGQKRALLDLYAANQQLPPIAMPRVADNRVLFRRASAVCVGPTGWSRESGRAADGSSGWRAIVRCRAGAQGPDFVAQMGVGPDAFHNPAWAGGAVTGYITRAPQHRALILGAFDRAPPALMLMADPPLPGLKPNPAAALADVPNNHLAYAVQWFLFAAIAAIIYVIALVRRARPVVSPPTRG